MDHQKTPSATHSLALAHTCMRARAGLIHTWGQTDFVGGFGGSFIFVVSKRDSEDSFASSDAAAWDPSIPLPSAAFSSAMPFNPSLCLMVMCSCQRYNVSCPTTHQL
eukprot:FR739323.1.p1 GENE.FR739323.1~~FR739323.1.p1  ORF type:complete len:107 (-),score=6.92 FR739323.1:277-597(-)